MRFTSLRTWSVQGTLLYVKKGAFKGPYNLVWMLSRALAASSSSMDVLRCSSWYGNEASRRGSSPLDNDWALESLQKWINKWELGQDNPISYKQILFIFVTAWNNKWLEEKMTAGQPFRTETIAYWMKTCHYFDELYPPDQPGGTHVKQTLKRLNWKNTRQPITNGRSLMNGFDQIGPFIARNPTGDAFHFFDRIPFSSAQLLLQH